MFLYIKMRKIDIDEDDKEIFIKKDMEECKRTRNVRLLRQIPIILSGLLWGYTITRHIEKLYLSLFQILRDMYR